MERGQARPITRGAAMSEGALLGLVVVVTGGAGGIGSVVAEVLAADGATVVVADVNGAGGERGATTLRSRGLRAHAHGEDVADRESVVSLMSTTIGELGKID